MIQNERMHAFTEGRREAWYIVEKTDMVGSYSSVILNKKKMQIDCLSNLHPLFLMRHMDIVRCRLVHA